eukprot:tig00001130_g7249.t1
METLPDDVLALILAAAAPDCWTSLRAVSHAWRRITDELRDSIVLSKCSGDTGTDSAITLVQRSPSLRRLRVVCACTRSASASGYQQRQNSTQKHRLCEDAPGHIAAQQISMASRLLACSCGTGPLLVDLDVSGLELAPASFASSSRASSRAAVGRGARAAAGEGGVEGALLQGIARLAGAVAGSGSLQRLALRCMAGAFDDDAAQGLAAGVEGSASLTSLDLAGNSIEDRGAEALAGALDRRGRPLQALLLQSNRVGPRGAAAIARLAACGLLAALDLSGNPWGRGAAALASALASPTAGVSDLGLAAAGLGPRGVEAVVLVAAESRTLLRVELACNGVDAGALEAVRGARRARPALALTGLLEPAPPPC